MLRPIRFWIFLFLVHLFSLWAASASEPVPNAVRIHYRLEIRNPEQHIIWVNMKVAAASAGTTLRFPAWYGLYQIQDFVRQVRELQVRCGMERRRLVALDKQSWKVAGEACEELDVQYRVYANEWSVFSSVINSEYGFLNLATVLFYLKGERHRPAVVEYILPVGWKAAMPLPDVDGKVFYASNYNELVDSPAELGQFQEYGYEQKGARYRLIVSGGGRSYPEEKILPMVRTITDYQTRLMREVPFTTFTFFFQFPRSRGTGGMEHRNAAVVSFSAKKLKRNSEDFASLVAHEFFHLWNGKRIRPRSLSPPDYARENYTPSLWVLEGLTNTYAEFTLVRTGLISRRKFYNRLAKTIQTYEQRLAVHFQSLTDASLSTWLEKYPDYRLPERSISYYRKGQVAGVLLDLAIRQKTGNRRSLDDVMRTLNREFGRLDRPFEESNDFRRVMEQVAGSSFKLFFQRYISGTDSLPYQKFLNHAGLRILGSSALTGGLGFVTAGNFDGPPVVVQVAPEGPARKAGLRGGEEFLALNGRPFYDWDESHLRALRPGQKVQLRFQRGDEFLTLEYRTQPSPRTEYAIEEIRSASAEQLAVRRGLLEGTTTPPDLSDPESANPGEDTEPGS